MDVKKFLNEIVKFCSFLSSSSSEKIKPIDYIINFIRSARIILVLDGLEVMQEDSSTNYHGNIRNPLLWSFLEHWIENSRFGLMILTSRFYFPQMSKYLGVSFRQLSLNHLVTTDGVALLRRLQIEGKRKLLEKYVEKLYGHPLALRILASSVNRECYGKLAKFKGKNIVFDNHADFLNQKLNRLLEFYEQQLVNGQKELLGIISLYKRPIKVDRFVTFLGKMKSLENTPLGKADYKRIEEQLELLINDFLIEKTIGGITTHPVIRDYFRSGNKIKGSRREVPDFLKSKPGNLTPQTIEEVRDLVEAVQLLCEEGEFKEAHYLTQERLIIGGYMYNIFKNLPALSEGLACTLAFVGTEESRSKINQSRVAHYCSFVGRYQSQIGNLEEAIKWRKITLKIRQKQKDLGNTSIAFQNISLIEMKLGKIETAKNTVSKALTIAKQIAKKDNLNVGNAFHAYYEFLTGDLLSAYQKFELSLQYDTKFERHNYKLSIAYWGELYVEFLVRNKDWKQFEKINTINIHQSKLKKWNNKLAYFYIFQAYYQISRGKFSLVKKVIHQAEEILNFSGMLHADCRLNWVKGLFCEAQEDYSGGLKFVKEALSVCIDKGFKLWQSDLLILRGRLFLLKFQKENLKDIELVEKAGDDGKFGLRIADETKYIWAKIDALELLADYHKHKAKFSNNKQEAKSAKTYTNEADALKVILTISDKQKKQVKLSAKKEFEQQLEEWKNKK